METIIQLILDYCVIWAPSLVAILGVVVSVIKALHASKEAINEVRSTSDFQELKNEVSKVLKENRELKEINKIAVEKVSSIKGYVDQKLQEKEEKE